MVYTTEYLSPLGTITLACDEEAIIGLWFNGQQYFGSILPRQTERQERPLFQDARRWLDVYFSGRAPDHLPPLRYRLHPLPQAGLRDHADDPLRKHHDLRPDRAPRSQSGRGLRTCPRRPSAARWGTTRSR